MLAKKTVIVEDFSREINFTRSALLREHGVISGISVIIGSHDRPFGILGAYTATQRTFADDDVHFLEAVANVLSAAIERARTEMDLSRSREELRSLAARLQQITENERALLARDIHDELSGTLTALKMDISLLPDRAAKDQNLFLEKLRSMSALIDRSLAHVRFVVSELRPVVLDKFGLIAAIEWQVAEFQDRSGIACEVHLPIEQVSLAPELATAFFRILQESLTNVARHADATKVVVDLKSEADNLILMICDNGKGIDDTAIHANGSIGLLSMRERALSFGGTTEITALPEGGTCVTVRIPTNGRQGTYPSARGGKNRSH